MTKPKLLKILKPLDYIPISDGRTEVPEKAVNHPRPYRLREVAKQFRKFHKIESNKLDFTAVEVPTAEAAKDKSCCTVACHAGWAFTALIKLNRANLYCAAVEDNYYVYMGFDNGYMDLSKYLFNEESFSTEFNCWAKAKPQLFGGTRGGLMFRASGAEAFVKPSDSDYSEIARIVTLEAIADRYDDIAYRIEQNR